MKRWTLGCLLMIAFVAGPAHATFHLWDVSEVYSNEDGSVQFVEFFTTFGSQQFVVNHQIQALTEGVPEMIYTIPQSLVVESGESTANRHFLFASPGFEAVAGVAPDYEWTGIFPFIHVGLNDAVALEGADTMGIANLPLDGVHSLLGDEATIADPTPTNFAGVTGTLPEPGSLAMGLAMLGGLRGLARFSRAGARRSR